MRCHIAVFVFECVFGYVLTMYVNKSALSDILTGNTLSLSKSYLRLLANDLITSIDGGNTLSLSKSYLRATNMSGFLAVFDSSI